MYQHLSSQGTSIDLPIGKVVCVGRNFVDHIEELNNDIPTEALLFHKPTTSLCHLKQPLRIPTGQGEVHNELEVAILMGKQLSNAAESDVISAIWGVGLALDLTLRDVQTDLKAKGLPWEKAKSFDNSCPVSCFIPIQDCAELSNIEFQLQVNQQIRQQGNSSHMIRNIKSLLAEISNSFTLLPGDIVLTGTPKGVGPLCHNDRLKVTMATHIDIETYVQ